MAYKRRRKYDPEAAAAAKEKRVAIARGARSAIDRLCTEIESGDTSRVDQFLKQASRFHRYSLRNQIMISIQCPHATRVASIGTWNKLGRRVKKGERGIMICAPAPYRREIETATGETEIRAGLGFKAEFVFDIAQTDGAELADIGDVSGDGTPVVAVLESVAAKRGIAVDYAALGGAEGYSTGGRIAIERDLAPARKAAALAHELAHEAMHWPSGDTAQSSAAWDKTIRETEAESVAYVVTTAFGLENENSVDYLRLYKSSAATIRASLDRIVRAAHDMLADAGVSDE